MSMYFSKETNGFYLSADGIKDAVEITNEYWQDLLAGQSNGKIITSDASGYPILVDPVITIDIIKAQTNNAVDAFLNQTVQAHGYTNIVSCVSYVNSTNDTYKAEAVAVSQWRDKVWEYVADYNYTLETKPSDVVSTLPVLVWPSA